MVSDGTAVFKLVREGVLLCRGGCDFVGLGQVNRLTTYGHIVQSARESVRKRILEICRFRVSAGKEKYIWWHTSVSLCLWGAAPSD